MAIVRVSPELAGHPLRGATMYVWDQSKYNVQAEWDQLAPVYTDRTLATQINQRTDPLTLDNTGHKVIYTKAPATLVLDFRHPAIGRLQKRDIEAINPELIDNWQFETAVTRAQPWALTGNASIGAGICNIDCGWNSSGFPPVLTPFNSQATQSVTLETGKTYRLQVRAKLASPGANNHALQVSASNLTVQSLNDDDFPVVGTYYDFEFDATALGTACTVGLAGVLNGTPALSAIRRFDIEAISLRKVD